MAIAELTAQRASTPASSGTSVSITYPSTPTTGNLLVVSLAWNNAATISATPSGWTQAVINTANASICTAIYYRVAGASEPTTHAWTLSASARSVISGSEWSGLTSTPLDKTSSNQGFGQSMTCGLTGTLAQADELVLASYAYTDGRNSVTPDNSQSLVTGDRSGLGSGIGGDLYGKTVSATTSVNYGGTLDAAFGNQNWTAAVATFQASSAITAALTGQSLTVSRGTLIPNTDKALTGQALTAGRGSLVPSLSRAITGQAVTLAAGTLTPSSSSTVALTGQEITTALGSVSVPATTTTSVALSPFGRTPVVVDISISRPRAVSLSAFTKPRTSRNGVMGIIIGRAGAVRQVQLNEFGRQGSGGGGTQNSLSAYFTLTLPSPVINQTSGLQFSRCVTQDPTTWTPEQTVDTGVSSGAGVWLGNAYGVLYSKTNGSGHDLWWATCAKPDDWTAATKASISQSGKVSGLTMNQSGVLLAVLTSGATLVSRNRGTTWTAGASITVGTANGVPGLVSIADSFVIVVAETLNASTQGARHYISKNCGTSWI